MKVQRNRKPAFFLPFGPRSGSRVSARMEGPANSSDKANGIHPGGEGGGEYAYPASLPRPPTASASARPLSEANAIAQVIVTGVRVNVPL